VALSYRHHRPSTSERQRSRSSSIERPKRPRKDLLIIECDSATLVAQHLDLGAGYARLLAHEFVSPFLPDKTVVLVKTSTKHNLLQQLADVSAAHGRFRAILLVGHSNPVGLQLTSDAFCNWYCVGEWLQPFEPQLVYLVACEAGKSEAVRNLFEPLKKTLRDVYACPVELHATQAAAFGVLIGMQLWHEEIGDKHALALRVVNYINTGGQLYHWKRNETGQGQEIPPAFWDSLATLSDHGTWDLAQTVTDFVQRLQRRP
jgi:hypothetical protein